MADGERGQAVCWGHVGLEAFIAKERAMRKSRPLSKLIGLGVVAALAVIPWAARGDEELTIAILGFSRSSSVSPSADHCARRIAHGVVPGVKLDRSLRSATS